MRFGRSPGRRLELARVVGDSSTISSGAAVPVSVRKACSAWSSVASVSISSAPAACTSVSARLASMRDSSPTV
jgi:hypothetical protein